MSLVAGVDGCKAGWICAFGDDLSSVRIEIFSTINQVTERLQHCAALAIDMPMGLPERVSGGGRGPEQAVRPCLGGRQSSVFAIPGRDAIYAVDPQPIGMDALKAGHQIASAKAKELSDPQRGVAFQSFNIFPKIREIDQFLLAAPDWQDRIFEVHPEVAFWRMNSRGPLVTPKKIKGVVNPAGIAERRTLLREAGLAETAVMAEPPRRAALDDLIDCLAALVAASHIAQGCGQPHPDPFTRDENGLRIAIWTWR